VTHQSTLSWQQQLQDAFHNLTDLCHYLELDANKVASPQADKNFPIRVPRGFAAAMEKGNPNDPLLKQVLPIADELLTFSGFSPDPVGDLAAITEVGVIHKYQGRALLITTGSCAINCRYCFRRNFPYTEFQLSKQKQQQAMQYLMDNPEISEVILSGGDPLLLSDNNLQHLIQQLDAIAHLKRIRIHSRLPIVLPARITTEFMNILQQSTKQIIVVVHCNHVNELSTEVKTACEKIRLAGVTLLNQSVLLKGINNNVLQLSQLSEKLLGFGILPYYLHLLDKASGTGHFEVPKSEAISLIHELKNCLPGYLVPKLAQEEAGKPSKTIIL
jgi:EF-P beta-lysylation protein EpmB